MGKIIRYSVILAALIFYPAILLADEWRVICPSNNPSCTMRNSLQIPVKPGTVAKSGPVYQSKTGKLKYCPVTVSNAQGTVDVPVECALFVSPTVSSAPVSAPSPTGTQTPESIQASKSVLIPHIDTRAGSAYVITGQRVRFFAPNGGGSACSIPNPCSPAQLIVDSQSGDLDIFRGGTYDKNYTPGWANANICLGSAQSGIALVAMPGEVAKFVRPGPDTHNICLARGSSRAVDPQNAAHNVTIAGFALQGGSGAIDGQYGSGAEKSGARGARIVRNDITADYTGNTMSAVITIGGNGWSVIDNDLHDFGTTPPINNNHAIYVAVGSSDVEIAYNRLKRLRLGHQIQVHTDGGFRQGWVWSNVNIHHNTLDGEVVNGTRVGDARGITVSDVADASTVRITNNVLRNLGQNFCGACVYHGNVEYLDNVFLNINGPGILVTNQGGGVRKVTALRNTFTGVSGGNYKFESYNGADLSLELTHD